MVTSLWMAQMILPVIKVDHSFYIFAIQTYLLYMNDELKAGAKYSRTKSQYLQHQLELTQIVGI